MPHELKKQGGQAMTEFVIAAAFVMVPLFIIVPVIGKYIDMKQASIQAARYASWEYTANYVDLRDQPGGFSGISSGLLPKKSQSQVINEARQRFLSDTSLPINSLEDKNGYDDGNRNPLWTYHNGLPMYTGGSGEVVSVSGSDRTPDKLGLGYIVGTIGKITKVVGKVLQAFGANAGFDAINPDENFSVDGTFSASLSIPVENAPDYTPLRPQNRAPLFIEDLDLKMVAKSGLLTESWGAGGRAHSVYQSGGLVPTTLLSGGVVQTVLDILSFIAPSLHSSSLKFGYPVNDPDLMDQVPVGALDGEDRELFCPGGKCEHY